MSAGNARRGAAPVGRIDDLPVVELATVLYFRLCCESGEGRAALQTEAARTLGTEPGQRWLGNFEQFVEVLTRFARRPLMCHGLGCRCLGADESAVATLVSAAAEGEREEAMLIGMLMVRPDMALSLAALAEAVGLGLKRMAMRSPERAERRQEAHFARH